MSLTISKLHKELGKAIENGCGRMLVCINKKTFTHPLESDGCIILPVETADIESVPIINDDGGFAKRKDGTEIEKTWMVLRGNNS